MINIMTLNVEDYWDSAEVMLKDAIEMSNGRHTLQSTYEKLKSGVMNLYGVFWGDMLLSYFVTTKVIYPAKTVLCILFCGGENVIPHIKKIEDFFKREAITGGCRGVEIIGRKGWAKVLRNNPELDFVEKGVFYEMDS